MVDGELHDEDGRPWGVGVWRALQPWRHIDTGDGRHGQVLVLAWGETNAHGNAYHGWSPTATWPRPIGVRSWQGPAGRSRPAAPRPPVVILLMLGGVAIAGATPRSQPDDSNARTLRFDVQFSDFFLVDVGEPNLSLGDYAVFHDLLCWSIPRRRRPVGPCMPSSGVGWQPSRFLADRGEAERALPWRSGWARSTRPRPSWAPPGRRCAKPSPATAWACRRATPRRSASGRSSGLPA